MKRDIFTDQFVQPPFGYLDEKESKEDFIDKYNDIVFTVNELCVVINHLIEELGGVPSLPSANERCRDLIEEKDMYV